MKRSDKPTSYLMIKANTNSEWDCCDFAIIALSEDWKQEQQKRQRMLDSLKKGDKVVTIGGMFGVITAISEKKVTLKLAEDVEVDFARSAISAF